MKKPDKIAAFFDFDKTLLTTDSAALGLKYLWELGLLPLPFITKVLFLNLFFQRHLLSERKMGELCLVFYKDKRLEPFVDGRCEFYEYKVKPRLSPNLLSRLKQHQEQGHLTVLISGALRYSLEPVTADLGMDHLLASDLETGEEGLLTGRSKGPLCIQETKAELALDLSAREGIDLNQSYAYGNHQSDIELLSMVAHPYAVEPTKPLLRHAKKKGWPVLGYY